ncbi:cytochrome P450, partial [Phenylobacterium terrae]
LAAGGVALWRRARRGPPLPRERSLDSTAALLREGYLFIGRRCRTLGSDVFRTRLMGRPAICAQGEAAARMFYEPGLFTRRGALPPTALLSLQDLGSVNQLDGAAHRWRKALFLDLVGSDRVAALGAAFDAEWRVAAEAWARAHRIVLFDEVREVITRAVCAWAGAPLAPGEARRRAREFGAMIDGAGAVGPRNWRGLLLRARTERWARRLIADARSGRRRAPPGSPLEAVAFHRDLDGRRLPVAIAAVELLNLLRPTVAVDRYIAFAALALHRHPGWRERLARDGAARTAFAQEVRRLYPFFPAVGGRALQPFAWRGRRFRRGTWVILDLFGTNRDPKSWREAEAFRPERFLTDEPNAHNFIPQGGGDPATGHRCPGEPITLELMDRALAWLAGEMRYEVPAQDLSVRLDRMPAIPASRMVLSGVRPAGAPARAAPA